MKHGWLVGGLLRGALRRRRQRHPAQGHGIAGVLAERAVPVEEATPALFDSLIAEVREQAATLADKDAAEKLVSDMLSIKASVAA